ncbi:MAG: hypothetical protein N838_16805 [Thiohalocapsa sp. PB-PSB1]|nr:MAG: hypothetical protein N838_16805 [Thiohalocapsa sp. PB-PSB1]
MWPRGSQSNGSDQIWRLRDRLVVITPQAAVGDANAAMQVQAV